MAGETHLNDKISRKIFKVKLIFISTDCLIKAKDKALYCHQGLYGISTINHAVT